MPTPNHYTALPPPTQELYQYAEDESGTRRLDDIYKTHGETVDVAKMAAQRQTSPLEVDLGPIVVVTKSEVAGPDGKHEIRMYELTFRYFLNPQTGQYVEVDPHDASQVQPVVIGGRWQTPLGKPTKYPVLFVAHPHTVGYTEDEIAPEHDKPDRQSPTVVGRQHLKRYIGADTYTY